MATIDRILLEQARKPDVRALAEIYDRYAPPIYRYLYRFLGDAAQAEDLTSEVFLRLLQALGTPRAPREQLQGWLYRVARNLAMDWFRQQARGDVVPLDEDLVASHDLPALALEKRQARQTLRQAISRLTADQQQVILLRFGEGYNIAQVGQLMDKSEGAIKLLQYRAIKRLGKLLEHEEKKAHDKKRGRTIRKGATAGNAGRTARDTTGSPDPDGQAGIGFH